MKTVLVGEVRTAEFALAGLVSAGHPPAAIFTTDVEAVMQRSNMGPTYYCDLVALGAEREIPVTVITDLTERADEVAALQPDYIWVMGWPYIVRDPILDIAPCIGMHPTRLPYRRGGAPMNWTILDDEPTGCVTLFRMRPGLDDGELLAQEDFGIIADDYVGDVAERIYAITKRLVAISTAELAAGTATWRDQDHSLATYTRRRTPADGRISWNDSAARIRNLVRATSTPFPGAWTTLDGSTVRVWRAEIPIGYRAPLKAAPGAILEVRDDGVLVSTRDNALLLTEAEIETGDTDDRTAFGEEHAGRVFD